MCYERRKERQSLFGRSGCIQQSNCSEPGARPGTHLFEGAVYHIASAMLSLEATNPQSNEFFIYYSLKEKVKKKRK